MTGRKSMRRILALSVALSALAGSGAFGADDNVARGFRDVGKGFREIGIATGKAAKEGGVAVGKAAKEAAIATGHAFRKAGREIRDTVKGK
jgi:hypothetical protein